MAEIAQRPERSSNSGNTIACPELTSGKSSEKDKIEALYQYVSTSVRYVNISFGIGRFQPHSAASVLKNAYGDCKDKSVLFTALLQAVGVHANSVLATPGLGILEPEVPFPAQFNHVFTSVELNPSPVFLDTTLGLAEPQVLMPGVRGNKALLIEEAKSQSSTYQPGLLFQSTQSRS